LPTENSGIKNGKIIIGVPLYGQDEPINGYLKKAYHIDNGVHLNADGYKI
jgi:spore germination protein YaaH